MKGLRNLVLLAFVTLAFGVSASAQLTGTKNIPGDYANLSAAVADLNTQGVGLRGVTLNVLAGNPQMSPANVGTLGGGYIIGNTSSAVLTTSSARNPIIIQGNGNTITAPATHVVGQLNDGIFKIIGADWVTISGFTMLENPANVNNTPATNTMTEFGIALFYVTTTDGAQNNVIQNNTIDLNRTYVNTFGIYSTNAHSSTEITASASSTDAGGANSGTKIFGNNITDVNFGIEIVGARFAFAQNVGIDIGGNDAGTGNTLTNYGTTTTGLSGYNSLPNGINGITVRNSIGFNISFNSITSSSGATGVIAGVLGGIMIPEASVQPAETFTNNINNNTIALTSHGSIVGIYGIGVYPLNSSPTSTMNINANNFTALTHTIVTDFGTTFAIIHSAHSIIGGPLVSSISNNTFTNITSNSSGSFVFIHSDYNPPSNGTRHINNNSIVTGFNRTGARGSVTCIEERFGSRPSTISNTNNNSFTNITLSGTTSITGIYNTSSEGVPKNIIGNTIGNISGGSGEIVGINSIVSNAPTTIYGNTVSNITGGGVITGIYSLGSIIQNTIHSLTSTGPGAVTGLVYSGSYQMPTDIIRNKIYGISNTNASGSATSIFVGNGISISIQNNFIGNITTPAANAAIPLIGINVLADTVFNAKNTVNIDFNTIYLNATSTGALFGSAAINASTTRNLTMRNNILVNLSTPNGAGKTVAYRRNFSRLGYLCR
jgi:trimeric autotransporter adhesin